MQKLDENGYLVEAADELFCSASSRELVAFLRSGFPTLEIEQTNMQSGYLPFLYIVLANSNPEYQSNPKSYLQCRGEVEKEADKAGFEVQGLLVLDEGAGHELYLAQPQSKHSGAFGREPILVWAEHKTGTVLCENSEELTRRLRKFVAASSTESGRVV